jgi:hypothetical protein
MDKKHGHALTQVASTSAWLSQRADNRQRRTRKKNG